MQQRNKSHKRIVKFLLASMMILCFIISVTAMLFFSDQWPRLDEQVPNAELSVTSLISIHAGSLIIFAMFLPLCLAKLQFGTRWKLWEPSVARWFTLTACGFLCISPFLFPLAIPAFYFSFKLTDDDFE